VLRNNWNGRCFRHTLAHDFTIVFQAYGLPF
jgi:hypothetical protein